MSRETSPECERFPRQHTKTGLVFGSLHTALAVQLDDDPSNTRLMAAFDNGVLAPSPTRAGTDLGHRVIRDLLDAHTTTRDWMPLARLAEPQTRRPSRDRHCAVALHGGTGRVDG